MNTSETMIVLLVALVLFWILVGKKLVFGQVQQAAPVTEQKTTVSFSESGSSSSGCGCGCR